MLRGDDLLGVIVLLMGEIHPFTDKQIELVTTFADQAVIAIENARLLNELRESLQQQTATSEVLSVISASPGELEPVFGIMLATSATELCEASYATMWLSEGGVLRNAPPSRASQSSPAAMSCRSRSGTPGSAVHRSARNSR
jgi:hypothetical protein